MTVIVVTVGWPLQEGKKNLQCFPFVYLRFHGVKPKSPDDPTSSTHFVKVSECHVFVDEMQ